MPDAILPLADLLDLPQGRLAVWLAVLVGVLLVGLVVVQQVKKRMNAVESNEERYSAGFTLSDLRDMYKRGEVSEEEFNKAKAKVIEAARRAAERDTTAGNQVRNKPLRAFPIEPKPAEPEEPGDAEDQQGR